MPSHKGQYRSVRTTKAAVARAGLVTVATGGAVLAGAYAGQPAALLHPETLSGSLDLRDFQAASAGSAARQAVPAPRAHDREAVRRAADRRVASERGPVLSRGGGDREPVGIAPEPAGSITALGAGPVPVAGGSATTVSRWTEVALDLWAAYGRHSAKLGEIGAGKQVFATGRSEGGRDEVVAGGKVAWVTSGHLSRTKPAAPKPASSARASSASSSSATGALDFSACGDASVEDGITAGAVKVYRAVCNAFPEVASGTTYGYDPHGEHASGKALDFMIDGDVDLGYRIRDFVQAHAAELDLYDIIYRQHIWTPVRASEGWRLMEDRGDPTANHMDHVHVSVN